jgi:hypothetical protein
MKLGLGLSIPGVATMGGKQLRYVEINGASGSYLSVPDSAALDITGDIDMRVLVEPVSWSSGGVQILASKATTAGGSEGGYGLQLGSTGIPNFVWVDNSNTTRQAAASTSVSASAPLWVRATLDVDDGAGGHAVNVFQRSVLTPTWTLVGLANRTAASVTTTQIKANNRQVGLGSTTFGTGNLLTGRIFAAQILNGINGTVVFDWDLTRDGLASASTSVALTGQTVTFNGTFTVSSRPIA